MTYVLGFDIPLENDEFFEIENVPCIMNKSHEMYVYGMKIDWQDGLNSRGLRSIIQMQQAPAAAELLLLYKLFR